MVQNFIEISGTKYYQGTVFVFRDNRSEKRMSFMYSNKEKNEYVFLTRNARGIECRVSMRATHVVNNLIRIDTPTELEKHTLQSYLKEEERRLRANKKHEMTEFELFLFILLMIVIIGFFPPAALVFLFVAFIYKSKK